MTIGSVKKKSCLRIINLIKLLTLIWPCLFVIVDNYNLLIEHCLSFQVRTINGSSRNVIVNYLQNSLKFFRWIYISSFLYWRTGSSKTLFFVCIFYISLKKSQYSLCSLFHKYLVCLKMFIN